MKDFERLIHLGEDYCRLHGIDEHKQRHDLALYVEPEEHKVLTYLHERNVRRVQPFLIWYLWYMPRQTRDAPPSLIMGLLNIHNRILNL